MYWIIQPQYCTSFKPRLNIAVGTSHKPTPVFIVTFALSSKS